MKLEIELQEKISTWLQLWLLGLFGIDQEHVTHLPGTFAVFLFQNCFLFPSVDIFPLLSNKS